MRTDGEALPADGISETAGIPAAPRRLQGVLPSLAVAGGLGLLEWLRGRFQRSQVFLPDRYPNGIWDPAPFGLTAEDVHFSSEDGVALHGWWVPHPKPVAAVLYCHGNSGSLAHRIGFFRFLKRLKVDLLLFDYRGYGRSAGTPSERGLFRDVRAAYDLLTGSLGRREEEVIVFGHSLGGAVAVELALHRRPAGLVVQSSFTDLRSMARRLYPQLPVGLLCRNQFRSIDKVGRLELPKLFVHGTGDGTVPFEMGRALYESAAAPKEFLAVERAGHNDLQTQGGAGYLRRLGRFIKRCVGR